MGWGRRILAAAVGFLSLGVGAWPVSLIALAYLLCSFVRTNAAPAVNSGEERLPRTNGRWGRYGLGAVLLLLAVVALGTGGTFSPYALSFGALAVLLWPLFRVGGIARQVVPVKESVLLRNRFLPFRWYAVAEVKLEAQDQSHGISALDGELLVFTGRASSAFLVVQVDVFGVRRAEERVFEKLRRDTGMLSKRGAHLLPLDSGDAVQRLSLTLDRLSMGANDLGTVSSLPFDVLALQTKEGVVVSQRAFRILEQCGAASVPASDLPTPRPPLLAEVVEKIGERHGWPGPDEYSPFLAALDASRAEPLADKIRTKGEGEGRVAVETPGGAEVGLTRAQLRAVARIYC